MIVLQDEQYSYDSRVVCWSIQRSLGQVQETLESCREKRWGSAHSRKVGQHSDALRRDSADLLRALEVVRATHTIFTPLANNTLPTLALIRVPKVFPTRDAGGHVAQSRLSDSLVLPVPQPASAAAASSVGH